MAFKAVDGDTAAAGMGCLALLVAARPWSLRWKLRRCTVPCSPFVLILGLGEIISLFLESGKTAAFTVLYYSHCKMSPQNG